MLLLLRLKDIVKTLGKPQDLVVFAALLLVHFAVAYFGMRFFGEVGIYANFSDFVYWYVTTTTTVGYGDISPQTEAGRYLAAFWVMIGGICLISLQFAWIVKIGVDILGIRMNGNISLNEADQMTVVIGWNPGKTDLLLDLLHQECSKNGDKIVLCDNTLDKNPMPGQIDFVKADSLLSEKTLYRAGVGNAKRVLIFSESDEQALSLSLLVNRISKSAHVVAHFSDSKMADLAKTYIPSLEIASSMTMEMLARSACDPGASDVIYELLSIKQGATLFSFQVKPSFKKSYGEFALRLRSMYKATLIAVRKRDSDQIQISPADDEVVGVGDVLFYIAEERLPDNVLH